MTGSSYRLCESVRFRLVRDEAVVLKQEEGETMVLNGVASRILQLLSDGHTLAETVSELGHEFDAAEDQLSSDVESFAADLVREGVLESVEERD